MLGGTYCRDSQLARVLRIRNRGVLGPKHLNGFLQGSWSMIEERVEEPEGEREIARCCPPDMVVALINLSVVPEDQAIDTPSGS